MAETQRFGLEKFGGPDGGAITDNGGKYSTVDRDTIDRLLSAFERHVHDAPFTATPLDDPTDAPAGTMATTGGTLPGGTTYYYRVSYVDQFGLETAGSDELVLATEDAPVVTDPPVVNGDSTAGDTLPPATYYYALTGLSAQGESSLGPQAIITTQPGQTGVLLTLPTLTNGITAYNVWRHGISDAGWTKIGINAAGPTFLDTGVPTGTCLTDPATQPPNSVTFAVTGTHAATITVPDTALVGQVLGPVRAWRLYRTDTSGNYRTESLVAEIIADDDATALDTSYVDTGGSLLSGRPLLTSTALTPSRRIFDAGDSLPAVTGYKADALFLDRSVPAFYVLINGAWAQLSPSSSGGGGGAGAVLANGPQAFMTGNVPYALPPNTDFVPEVTPAAVSLDQSGVDVRPGSDGPANWDGLVVYAAGDYGVEASAHVTGLVPGDVVRLTIAGATTPSFLTSDITVPNGQTEVWATLAHVVNMAYPNGGLVFGRVAAFTEQTAPSLEYWSLAMRMSRGTPTAPTGVPDAPTDVSATPAGSGTLQIAWTAPAGDIVDYLVTVSGTRYTATGSSLTVSGLGAEPAQYDCTIAARTAVGYGPTVTFAGTTSG